MSKKPNLTPPPVKHFSLMQKIVNGAIAGVVGIAIVFPLDLVKTRLQNQQVGPNGERQYTSMIDCFRKTHAREGFKGMYSGVGINMLLISPEKAGKLAANDFCRHHLTLPDGSLPMPRQMLAGAVAGVAQACISCPMELLKIQMQDAGRVAAQNKSSGNPALTMSSFELTRKLLRERGITGLYKGATATGIRDILFNVIYFPMFAEINDFGSLDKSKPAPPWWSFVAGCSAGSTAALALTPMDVVKTRLQTISKGVNERQYTGTLDVMKHTWRTEGIRAFFKGGACRMIVIAPLYGIVQVVYFLGIAEKLGVP